MAAAVLPLIVFATLAFGAVYPWGYRPVIAVAACIGIAGLVRHRGIPSGARAVSAGLLLVAAAVAVQLIPLPRAVLGAISPHTSDFLSDYSLTFAAGTGVHPLSVNSNATANGLFELLGLGVYMVGLCGLLSRRRLRTLPRNLTIFAVMLALVGVFGRQHNNGLVFGFWQPVEGSNSNGFGPFVNRNHFAGWMLMATCLALGSLCGRIEPAFARVKPGLRNWIAWLSQPEASRLVLTGFGIAAMAISLVWTISRSGILSFVCVLACFAYLTMQRHHLARSTKVFLVAMLGIVLFTSLNWRGIKSVGLWFTETADFKTRLGAWQDGWSVIRDFPITGTGINTYPDVMLFYQRHVREYAMTHAHNDYLQLFVEGGLMVVVPAALAVILLAVTIARRLREARHTEYDYWVRAGAGIGLIAIAAQEAVEFSLHIPANALLCATLAAVAICPVDTAHASARP